MADFDASLADHIPRGGRQNRLFANEESGAGWDGAHIGLGDHVFRRLVYDRRRLHARWRFTRRLAGRNAPDLPLEGFAHHRPNLISILFWSVIHAPLPPAASSQSGSS